jgi:outer membrane protein OmpA-like peptidoglycan-associated protein
MENLMPFVTRKVRLMIALITAAALSLVTISPASAAPITTYDVTSSGLVAGQANPNPITISLTSVTPAVSSSVTVSLPSGWSWVTYTTSSNGSNCTGTSSYLTTTGFSPDFCRASTGIQISGRDELFVKQGANGFAFASGIQVTLTLAAGSVNVGSGTDFELSFTLDPTINDSVTVSIAPPSSPAPAPAPAPAASITSNTPVEVVSSVFPSKAKFRFVKDSSALTTVGKKQIKKDLDKLRTANAIVITAEVGITSTSENAKALASNRTEAVKNYLIGKGIPREKITVKLKVISAKSSPFTKVVGN